MTCSKLFGSENSMGFFLIFFSLIPLFFVENQIIEGSSKRKKLRWFALSYLGFFIKSVELLLPFKENLSSPLYIYLKNIIRSDHYISEPTTGTLRSTALKHIINYYSLHVENFGEIKSVKVLSQVFK